MSALRSLRLGSTPKLHRLETDLYRVAFAENGSEVTRALQLRYQVFNLELGEGLSQSVELQLDQDLFDPVCYHLLVWHLPSREVIGTYRMQTGQMATQNLGYYSAQEFDFSPYSAIRPQLLELGRACVHRDHRNLTVLHLLWRGIVQYAVQNGIRYLLGCSSLTSQDPNLGWATYEQLRQSHLVDPAFRTVPLLAFALAPASASIGAPTIPKLLRTYLALGAKICGPPALDQGFKTIDFLTLIDFKRLSPTIRQRFF